MTPLLLSALLAGEVDAQALARVLDSQKGRVVVLSFWATWCEPCVREFPDLVALARERRDIAFVAVSIDEKEDRPLVESFLAERRPPFPVYLKAPGPDEAFISGVDPAWSGAIPATLVFDRRGRLGALLEGEHSRADIEKAVAALEP